jgi:lipoprotein-anchoring transpeptidase ErfK/SrfK
MESMKQRFLLLAGALAALALVACNGGGNSFTAPTPGPTCNPGTTAEQLVYPAPGATNVPVSTTQIVIAVNTPLPNYTWNLALTDSAGTAYTANPLTIIAASQLPSGSASTTITNPTYESVQLVQQLPASTTFTAIAINNPNSYCTPLTIPGATFTTQQ